MIACGWAAGRAEAIVRRHGWHDLDRFYCGPPKERIYWQNLPIASVGVAPQGDRRAVLQPRSTAGEAPAIANALQGAAGHGRGGGFSGGAPAAAPRAPKQPPPGYDKAKKQVPRGSIASAPAAGAAGRVIASTIILRARATIDSTVSRRTTNHGNSSVTKA